MSLRSCIMPKSSIWQTQFCHQRSRLKSIRRLEFREDDYGYWGAWCWLMIGRQMITCLVVNQWKTLWAPYKTETITRGRRNSTRQHFKTVGDDSHLLFRLEVNFFTCKKWKNTAFYYLLTTKKTICPSSFGWSSNKWKRGLKCQIQFSEPWSSLVFFPQWSHFRNHSNRRWQSWWYTRSS